MMLDFKNDYILEDEYVLLRPLVVSDYPHLLDFAINEPDLWRFNLRGAGSAEQLKTYLSYAAQRRAEGQDYRFIIYSKQHSRYIGCTGFHDIRPDLNVMDIGFTWYGKAYQGTNINKCCKLLLLQFAFEKLGADRVGFRANNMNERSKHAMKRIGCREEGVLRNFAYGGAGERIDVVVLSILKDEWFSGVKENLQNQKATCSPKSAL